jgi:hypothetical protein
MQPYTLNCSFLLNYDTEQVSLDISFSDQFTKKYELSYDELSLIEKEITHFLHRYDYRKLNYFVEAGIAEVFDTLMRFTFKKSKYPLRTVAVCKVTKKGLSCVHFEESNIVQLRKLKRSDSSTKLVKYVNIENENELQRSQHAFISEVKQHLVQIIARNQKIV